VVTGSLTVILIEIPVTKIFSKSKINHKTVAKAKLKYSSGVWKTIKGDTEG
jgi:hypothetical protein